MPEGSAVFQYGEFIEAIEKIMPFLNLAALPIVRGTGEEIVKVAKSLAPVETQALQGDIKVQGTGTDEHGPWVEVGTREPYALYQEFGTTHNPPHPFMRPAIAQVTGLGAGAAAGFVSRLALTRKPRLKK